MDVECGFGVETGAAARGVWGCGWPFTSGCTGPLGRFFEKSGMLGRPFFFMTTSSLGDG